MKARGQKPLQAHQPTLEKLLFEIFTAVDRERPVNIFEPPRYREEKARDLGIDANSELQDILDATRKYPDVFAYLAWVRERLLHEARSGGESSHAKIRAWVGIVGAKVLRKRESVVE